MSFPTTLISSAPFPLILCLEPTSISALILPVFFFSFLQNRCMYILFLQNKWHDIHTPTFFYHPAIHPEEPALPHFCLLCFEVAGLGWNPGVAITSCAALGLTSPVALFPRCKWGWWWGFTEFMCAKWRTCPGHTPYIQVIIIIPVFKEDGMKWWFCRVSLWGLEI